MKVQGQLKHHFWGEYSATICLRFESPEDCLKGIDILNQVPTGTFTNACGGRSVSHGWVQAIKPEGAIADMGGEQLEKTIDLLESFGADRKLITSMRKSIDRGEVFEFEIKN